MPQPHRSIGIARRQPLPIHRHRHRPRTIHRPDNHLAPTAPALGMGRSRIHPQPDRAVATATHPSRHARNRRQGQNRRTVPPIGRILAIVETVPRAGIPDAHAAIGSPRGDRPPIVTHRHRIQVIDAGRHGAHQPQGSRCLALLTLLAMGVIRAMRTIPLPPTQRPVIAHTHKLGRIGFRIDAGQKCHRRPPIAMPTPDRHTPPRLPLPKPHRAIRANAGQAIAPWIPRIDRHPQHPKLMAAQDCHRGRAAG